MIKRTTNSSTPHFAEVSNFGLYTFKKTNNEYRFKPKVSSFIINQWQIYNSRGKGPYVFTTTEAVDNHDQRSIRKFR